MRSLFQAHTCSPLLRHRGIESRDGKVQSTRMFFFSKSQTHNFGRTASHVSHTHFCGPADYSTGGAAAALHTRGCPLLCVQESSTVPSFSCRSVTPGYSQRKEKKKKGKKILPYEFRSEPTDNTSRFKDDPLSCNWRGRRDTLSAYNTPDTPHK